MWKKLMKMGNVRDISRENFKNIWEFCKTSAVSVIEILGKAKRI